MTVSSTPRRAGPFLGNDVTASFPFTFKVFSAAEVQVTLKNAAGVESVLTSGFTVTLNADQDNEPGGSVGYPLATGESLTITGDLPAEQQIDLTNLSRRKTQAIENGLDYLTVLVQQQQERQERALSAQVNDPDPIGALPAQNDRKGRVLSFDSTTGQPVAGPTTSEIGGAAAAAATATAQAGIATAQAGISTANRQAIDGRIYPGTYGVEPAARPTGGAPQEGDRYVSTTGVEFIRLSGAWVDYRSAAAASALQSATSAGTSTTQAGIATTQAGLATSARQGAEAARDAANTAGRVFSSTAAGLAGTTNGQSFSVFSGDFIIQYRNDAGSATEVGRFYSRGYIDGIINRALTARGWVVAATDLAGKLAWGVTSAGRFILGVGGDIVARITTNEASITEQRSRFAPNVRGQIFAWAVVDAARSKVALAVDYTGRLLAMGRDVLAEIDAASTRGTPRAVRENSAYIVFQTLDANSRRQIRTLRKSDGRIVQLTNSGNNVDPVLTSDNRVMFLSDATGTWVQSHVSADGGAIAPALASSTLACWGDSLTAGARSSGGLTYPAQLATLLGGGRQAFNGGIGGQGSSQIAARQGGAPSLLTVTGNQIPASGAVAVTARTVNLLTNQGTQSLTGTLAGVPGTLARAGDDSYSFTRTTAGSAVACPAGTAFEPDLGVQYRSSIAILIYGRNDGVSGSGDASGTLAALASSVAYLSPYYRQFIVGLVLNGTTEGIGSGTYNNIIARNNAIKAAYPNNWVDTQSPPTADEMAALGFVPDATDLADIANGCIPTRMRNFGASDTLHLNNTGYALWALRIRNFIQAKGW